MRHSQECLNIYKEEFLAILEGIANVISRFIGNAISRFMKFSEMTKWGRNMPYDRLCLYEYSQPLLESIDLEYQGAVLTQHLDYEHVSFCCCHFHEHQHLLHDCPSEKKEEQELGRVVHEGFQKFIRKAELIGVGHLNQKINLKIIMHLHTWTE